MLSVEQKTGLNKVAEFGLAKEKAAMLKDLI